MNRNDQGSEDNAQAVENVRHVAENRDALADQARRVDATAPSSVDTPVEGFRAPGAGSENNAQSAANARDAAENRQALEAQARRVEATAPPEINTTGPQNS